MVEVPEYDAVGISDTHLGAGNSRTRQLRHFLRDIDKGKIVTKVFVILGDGVDSPNPRRLRRKDWRILRRIRKLRKVTRVIWLVGNHDPRRKDIQHLFGIPAAHTTLLYSGGVSVYVSHGHQFDDFVNNHPIVTGMADLIYKASQVVDPSHRLAKTLKHRSKRFVKCARKVGLGVAMAAKAHKCTVAWHGHNHQHGQRSVVEGVEVWDTGCWTEKPCTYLTLKDGVTEQHEYEV